MSNNSDTYNSTLREQIRINRTRLEPKCINIGELLDLGVIDMPFAMAFSAGVEMLAEKHIHKNYDKIGKVRLERDLKDLILNINPDFPIDDYEVYLPFQFGGNIKIGFMAKGE